MTGVLLWCVLNSVASADVRFEPPDGKVLHMAGQSQAQFSDYVRVITEDGKACPLPAGGAAYTALTRDSFNPDSKDSRLECGEILYLLGWAWPMTLHLALWLGAYELEDIEQGNHDDLIRRLGKGLRQADRPVYFRIGYEFDGPHNAYPPENYQKAYRRIVDVLREMEVKNVAYVWHGYAYLPTFEKHGVMAWYPGDGYVDWIGISLFAAGSEQLNVGRMLEVAREKGKPMMICESSATKSGTRKNLSGKPYWDAWYVPFFEFIEQNPEVKGFSIINYDWGSNKMWKELDWGDARLTVDNYVTRRWREKMKESRYLHSSADLYRTLGYEK